MFKKILVLVCFTIIFNGCQKDESVKTIKVSDIKYNFYSNSKMGISYVRCNGESRFGYPLFNTIHDSVVGYRSIAFQGYEGYYTAECGTPSNDSVKIEVYIDNLLKYSKKDYKFVSISFNN